MYFHLDFLIIQFINTPVILVILYLREVSNYKYINSNRNL